MNTVVITGQLSKEFSEMKTAYEGILNYTSNHIRSGNLVSTTKQVGVYLPKDLFSIDKLFELTAVDVFLGLKGMLVSSEIDKKTKTSSVVITQVGIISNPNNELENRVVVDGVVSGLIETPKGFNFSLVNPEEHFTTRVYSYSTELPLPHNGDTVEVKGSIRSYPYKSKVSGKLYNVCGVTSNLLSIVRRGDKNDLSDYI